MEHLERVSMQFVQIPPYISYFSLISLQLDISDSLVLAAAEQFISLGLKDTGYEYVNIDVRLRASLTFVNSQNFIPGLLGSTSSKSNYE